MADATCAVCTGPCPPPVRGSQPRRYCSAWCRNRRPRQPKSEAAKQRSRERDARRSRLDGRRTITQSCGWCEQPFESRPVDKLKHCSRSCASKAQWQARRTWPSSPIYVYDCLACGKAFTSRRQRTWPTCSTGCADREYNQRVRPGPSSELCECGASLPSLQRRKCDGCLEKSRRERRQRQKRAERARKRGIVREPYTLAEIAKRDRYHCGLCRRRVAMTKAVPHPKAPTIDHIVPVDAGGDDTRANVQLAHFSCNTRKHTGGSQQLRLIG